MSKPKDNNAFPSQYVAPRGSSLSLNGGEPVTMSETRTFVDMGMTLRDYFAARTLLVVPEMASFNMKDNEARADYMARRAYEYADAMLKARA